jgi:hypothetical protein
MMTNVNKPLEYRKERLTNKIKTHEAQPKIITMNKIFKDSQHALIGMVLAEAALPFHYYIEHAIHANNGVDYHVDFHVSCQLGSFYLLLHEEPREPKRIKPLENYWVCEPDFYLYGHYNRPIQKICTGVSPRQLYQGIQTLVQSINPDASLLSFEQYQDKIKAYFSKIDTYKALY